MSIFKSGVFPRGTGICHLYTQTGSFGRNSETEGGGSVEVAEASGPGSLGSLWIPSCRPQHTVPSVECRTDRSFLSLREGTVEN